MSGIFAFGDSYLDSGAALRVSSAAVAAGIPGARLIPAPPGDPLYATGRWSDGPSMVEHLAAQLGWPLVNYAIGGARAMGGNYHAWLAYFTDTGLAAQVDSFGFALGDRAAPPDGIYIVAAGANDYFQYQDFLQPGYIRLDTGPERLSLQTLAAQAAGSVANTVERLAARGARRFLVSEQYALDLAPFVTTNAPQVDAALSYIQAFDRALHEALAAQRQDARELRVIATGELMRAIAADPAGSGLTDVTRACQRLLPVPRPPRGPPERYFWWDEYHPSAAVQRLLGEALVSAVRAAGWQ